MERIEYNKKANSVGFVIGEWGVRYDGRSFRLDNDGEKLVFLVEEEIESLVFDMEKKTFSVKLNNPSLSTDCVRSVDLSGCVDFFEKLRDSIADILLCRFTGGWLFKPIAVNRDRTVFDFNYNSGYRIESNGGFQMGNWSVTCGGKRFKLNNHGIKLISREDEDLEKIIFDVENKTVSVVVNNPTLPERIPRTVDLSDAPEFFEELRKDIEKILTTKGTFKSVTPNDDRTVFEVDQTNSLYKDLCMRLPYSTMVQTKGNRTVTNDPLSTYAIVHFDDYQVKPYLRPMSSMTEEEKNRFNSFMEKDDQGFPTDVINKEKVYEYLNWLLANHFDFRGLIDKGLAISTEVFNPYKH